MRVKFWGVRGSLPTPLTPEQVKRKISAVVQRIQPADLATPQSRERFLARLPAYLFGTVGGNTTCLEVSLRSGEVVLMDAGSGMAEYSREIARRQLGLREFHIFFTHFHWDHLMGLPFFMQFYGPHCRATLYSPVPDFEKVVRDQMRNPYFPVPMDVMKSQFVFKVLEKSPVEIGGAQVTWKAMKHPGGCYSYKVTENERSVIFATDSEITAEDFQRIDENRAYFRGTELLILDAQYTLGEAIEKFDWGHTSYSLAVELACELHIRKLVLFHHEPSYEDKKVWSIHQSAEWYRDRMADRDLEVYIAQEGLVFEL
jgi:phosphoribosyl 1,2-cyclic phosphodiesterase